jgi:fibronectin type 3 domain-containing protein
MNPPFKSWARVAALMLALVALVILGQMWRHRTAEPHRVTLTWQAPPPVSGITIVGYNVYRRASEGTSFVKIATKVPGPPYDDWLVSSGRTYFYAVTSVDQRDRESRFSSVVQTSIP